MIYVNISPPPFNLVLILSPRYLFILEKAHDNSINDCIKDKRDKTTSQNIIKY